MTKKKKTIYLIVISCAVMALAWFCFYKSKAQEQEQEVKPFLLGHLPENTSFYASIPSLWKPLLLQNQQKNSDLSNFQEKSQENIMALFNDSKSMANLVSDSDIGNYYRVLPFLNKYVISPVEIVGSDDDKTYLSMSLKKDITIQEIDDAMSLVFLLNLEKRSRSRYGEKFDEKLKKDKSQFFELKRISESPYITRLISAQDASCLDYYYDHTAHRLLLIKGQDEDDICGGANDETITKTWQFLDEAGNEALRQKISKTYQADSFVYWARNNLLGKSYSYYDLLSRLITEKAGGSNQLALISDLVYTNSNFSKSLIASEITEENAFQLAFQMERQSQAEIIMAMIPDKNSEEYQEIINSKDNMDKLEASRYENDQLLFNDPNYQFPPIKTGQSLQWLIKNDMSGAFVGSVFLDSDEKILSMLTATFKGMDDKQSTRYFMYKNFRQTVVYEDEYGEFLVFPEFIWKNIQERVKAYYAWASSKKGKDEATLSLLSSQSAPLKINQELMPSGLYKISINYEDVFKDLSFEYHHYDSENTAVEFIKKLDKPFYALKEGDLLYFSFEPESLLARQSGKTTLDVQKTILESQYIDFNKVDNLWLIHVPQLSSRHNEFAMSYYKALDQFNADPALFEKLPVLKDKTEPQYVSIASFDEFGTGAMHESKIILTSPHDLYDWVLAYNNELSDSFIKEKIVEKMEKILMDRLE